MKKLFTKFFALLIAALCIVLVSCENTGNTIKTLATPGGLKYESEQIMWNEVANATNGYSVIVKQNDKEVINQTITKTSITVAELAAGNYTVYVKAIEVKDAYKESNTAKLDFTVVDKTPVKTTLETPSNITYDSKTQTVKWDKVENANSYKIKAVKTNSEDTVIEEQTVTDLTISVKNLETKNITLTIQALASKEDETYLDSEVATYSFTIVPTKLATPTNLKYENDIISFDSVDNSDCYQIIIMDKNTEEVKKELSDTIETTMNVSDLGKGDYVLKVIAYAEIDAIYYADSDQATMEFTIASLGKLSTPEITGINGGNIVWTTNNARDYEITIVKRGTTEEVSTEGISVVNNSFMLAGLDVEDGDYTFKIKALSNRHDESESAVATYDFTLKTAKAFDATTMATFNGTQAANNWGGEHASVELVEIEGVKYALVTPTADGWGRVASPQFTVNFNNNPVLFLEMGSIFGGFHVQMTYDGTLYKVLDDTMKEGNIAISLTGVKTESGVTLNASGIQTIAIRLGVDNSTTTTANDAKAHYHQMKVVYLTEYKEQSTVETKLETPDKLGISEVGTLTWLGVENATHYVVTIVDKNTNNSIEDTEIDNTSYVAYNLQNGDYTITVKAINKTNALFTESDQVSYTFTVKEVVNYTGNEMQSFVCGGGDNPAIQYNDDNTITLNPNGAVGWGWVWDKNGVTVDLDKNPLVIVNIEKSNEGGYLARATYDGTGDIVMANDTAGAFDTQKTLVFRASKNVDGNNQGSGVVEGYKFGIGVRGNGEIVVSTIRILTITEYKEALTEETTLSAPLNLSVSNNSEIKWDSVENATAYSVKIIDEAEKEIANISTIKSVFSVATLQAGTYTISVTATNKDNDLILDSKASTFKFKITEAVSYTSADMASFVKGDGDGDIKVELDEETGFAKYNPDKKGWGWLFPEVGTTLDMSLNPFIVVTAESIEAGYLARATYEGSDTIVMLNDTRNPSDSQTIIVMRANVNVDGNPVSNVVVENYKFGFGFIDGSVNAISNIRIIYVTPVTE